MFDKQYFMDVADFRVRFEPVLRAFLLQKEKALEGYTNDPTLQEWIKEAHRLVFAGGKRVRPLLLTIGYLLNGGKDEPAVLQAAVALELFHLFALIHDDVMDKGEERHGVPTSHRRIATKLRELGRKGDVAHVGTSQAILIGDLAFSWSIEALTAAPFSRELIAEALQRFFRMSDEVMVGQMLDVDLTTRTHSSEAEVHQKMLLKTAGYTFSRPLQIGIALAGGSNEYDAFADTFGSSLGVAFQIQDDILDAFGTFEETGKTSFSDLRDHQHSLLTQWVMDHGNVEDRAMLLSAWGSPEHDTQTIERVQSLFSRTGALAAALTACRTNMHHAETLLTKTSMSEEMRDLFRSLFTRAMQPDLLQAIETRARTSYAVIA